MRALCFIAADSPFADAPWLRDALDGARDGARDNARDGARERARDDASDAALAGAGATHSADSADLCRVQGVPNVETLGDDRPIVVIVDRSLLAGNGEMRPRGERHPAGGPARESAVERLRALAGTAALLGVGGTGEREPQGDVAPLLSGYIAGDATAGAAAAQVRGALRLAEALAGERRRTRELHELTRVGAAISTERNLVAVLERILTQARRLSGCDAGSLYLAEPGSNGGPGILRFRIAQNASLPDVPFTEYTIPIDHGSLAGYAAVTGTALSVPDVYALPVDAVYRQNRTFDERFGYHTQSVLVLPMKTHRDEVVGVLQLINRTRRPGVVLSTPAITDAEVVPFDDASVTLVSALASLGAVAIENARLYEDIERLFEGFVTAAVTAIESRDPSTHGHSARVASLSVALAEAITRDGGRGAHRGLTFTREQLRELRYAGLLHDFGKVGVREDVLTKEKKLYPRGLELIRLRLLALRHAADSAFERGRAEHLERAGTDGYAEALRTLEEARRATVSALDRYLRAVMVANEPAPLSDDALDELRRVSRLTYRDIGGEEREVLTGEEFRLLTIRRGTLDEAERREIESHVGHTQRFLTQIPWTPALQAVPTIAAAHHEKLNGSGYPSGLRGEAIPIQTRILTIVDIFDALTAADRPYKRAVSPERALAILEGEAAAGELDADLLATFIAAGLYAVRGA